MISLSNIPALLQNFIAYDSVEFLFLSHTFTKTHTHTHTHTHYHKHTHTTTTTHTHTITNTHIQPQPHTITNTHIQPQPHTHTHTHTNTHSQSQFVSLFSVWWSVYCSVCQSDRTIYWLVCFCHYLFLSGLFCSFMLCNISSGDLKICHVVSMSVFLWFSRDDDKISIMGGDA